MAPLLRSLLIVAALGLFQPALSGQNFYVDDPLWKDPPPVAVGDVSDRDIDALYDFLWQSFRPPTEGGPSRGVNTLGEVPDSAWYTNRHASQRMTRAQLKRGPGNENPPEAPFVITGAKTEGITPGFEMRDAKKRLYFVKTDPLSNPEMSTAADVIGSKFFYALGYNTPENYILKMSRKDAAVAEDAEVEAAGRKRRMTSKDLDLILDSVPRQHDGTYRLLASLALNGKPAGPFRYEGTRNDDPNDIVPHESRRDLRGLFVFAAWLNHTDSKAGNTLDMVVEENGVRFLRHYLIDFGAILGSDSDMPKNARYGHEYIFPSRAAALRGMASLGLYSPDWERAEYPPIKAVGRFEAKQFKPEDWKSNYPNPAFTSRQFEDEYWAATKVLAFTNDDIRAIVETGEFSDPRAVDYIVNTLAQRRDSIAKAYLSKALALDNFRVNGEELAFDDLAAIHGLTPSRRYQFRWTAFDNQSSQHTTIPNETLAKLPASATNDFIAAEITASDSSGKSVMVYLRKGSNGWSPVGVQRK